MKETERFGRLLRPWNYHCKPLNLTPKQYKLLAEIIKREIKTLADSGNIKHTSTLCDIYDKILKLI